MAKNEYIGVSSIARKCSKMYIGVSGVARKIKKAYFPKFVLFLLS